MQKIIKQIETDLKDTIEIHYPGKKILYYDIETTGLSASRSMVYLIGMAYKNQECYEMVQLFADNAIDEEKLILEFLDILHSFDIVVSFNGDNFDMSFLKKRAEYLGLNNDIWNGIGTSLDIYKKIRKYAGVLGMENAKQKTIESFIGIQREDMISGKEMITVYRNYLIQREKNMYDTLLLHNREDVCGLFGIAGLLSYCDIFEGNWEITSMEIIENGILMLCQLGSNVLKEINLKNSYVSVRAYDNQLKFILYSEYMELKYFYADYKNYYYLPQEDMAIHKSVAGFVEKEYKRKATKESCYIKKNAAYIRNNGLTNVHIMKKEFSDKDTYVEMDELIQLGIQSLELKNYLLSILNSF